MNPWVGIVLHAPDDDGDAEQRLGKTECARPRPSPVMVGLLHRFSSPRVAARSWAASAGLCALGLRRNPGESTVDLMLDTEFPAQRLWGPPDWGSLGLVLCLAGGFLLAHGTLVRDPQSLVEERFGRPRADLRSLRSMLFHRVQTLLGFGLLLLGFAAQLYARAIPQPSGSSGSAALWTGAVVLAAALLELSAWWWSLVTVRHHLRGWFRQHPPDFDRDAALAREVGDLFGIDSHADEAVQSYAERLRRELGLRAPSAPEQRHSPPDDEDFAE